MFGVDSISCHLQVTSKKQSDWHWINGEFMTLLKEYRVWDMNDENVAGLRGYGVNALATVRCAHNMHI